MKDEIDTEGLPKKSAGPADKTEPATPENVDDTAVAAEHTASGDEDASLDRQSSPGQTAPSGLRPDGTPDQIPGFLRRCARETLAQERPVSSGAEHGGTAGEVASGPPSDIGSRRSADYAVGIGSGFPTGARLRGETGPQVDHSEPKGPPWSNTARSALSELLTDIDNEQARRTSNRDKFAALASKRRTTWPLTALIVSFLLVVVAYSVRNVDAGGTPAKVWRQALALVVGPGGETGGDTGANLAPRIRQGEPPVAVTTDLVADNPPVGLQPVARKKSTGLVFEPVKIVGPLSPVEPVQQRAAVKKPELAQPPVEAKPRLRQAPAVSANVAAPAPVSPPAASENTPSTTIALAPSVPVSPDKMPLASLAISTPRVAPDTNTAPRRFRQVASVSPGLIGLPAKSRVDVAPAPAVAVAPTPAPAPEYKIAAVTPQPPIQDPPILQSLPAGTGADPDSYGIKPMLARAEKLLESRDVASARLLFERAASYGSAEGAFGAAKTYDPVCFEKLGVYGVPAEPEKAAALYQIAIDAGHVKAVEYLNSLNALRRKMKLKATTAQR